MRLRLAWGIAGAVTTGALLLTGSVMATAAPRTPQTGTPHTQTTRTVGYHGYQVTVPAAWKVVDLAKNPDACVRFDAPAVYLGHPADVQDCPAHLVGRTAGLVIEPLDQRAAQHVTPDVATAAPDSAAAPSGTVFRNDAAQVAVQDAGVLVTAEDTPQTEPAVRDILTSARLGPGGTPAKLARPATDPGPLTTVPQPGTYNGKGFDACTAPSTSAMNAWRASSPYRAAGVYISGGLRACSQGNLTSSWVNTQTANGWHLIPIDVGRQAPCGGFSTKISTDPATARSQGSDAATSSVSAATSLGIPAGSVIYSDIENYSSTSSCATGVVNYLSGWTSTLHAHGYLGGVYSNPGSGIKDASTAFTSSGQTPVDHIWYANWNDAADTTTGLSSNQWLNHQRIHQYHGGVTETYGGVSINIDRNFLDVAAGTPPPPDACTAANLDFTSYATLSSGSTGAQVTAAQCLLRAAGDSTGSGDPTGVFDAGTVAATQAFQSAHGLAATGTVDSHTWTALLSRGSTPTLQNGSTGVDVSRLQRSLTAALSRTVGIDGDFGPLTQQAVTDYQSSRGLSADGIVGPQTWGALQSGK